MYKTHVTTLRDLRWTEFPEAAHLLARGMYGNPLNVQAFGRDSERRLCALTRFFVPVLRGLYRRGLIVGAFSEDRLVGVCGMAPPGFCKSSPTEKLAVIPSLLFANPHRTLLQILRWVGEWERRDPAVPHWHLGPVAVDPDVQGRGIGSRLLAAFCGRMDKCHGLSYLETDKPENVRFYEKFGFTVVAQARVLEVPNWFMSRPSRGEAMSHRDPDRNYATATAVEYALRHHVHSRHIGSSTNRS